MRTPQEYDLVRLLEDLGPKWACSGTKAVIVHILNDGNFLLEFAIPDKSSISGYSYEVLDAYRQEFFLCPK